MSIFVIVCFNEHQSGHNAADAFRNICIIKAVSHAKTKVWCERPPEKDLTAPTDPSSLVSTQPVIVSFQIWMNGSHVKYRLEK